jgi:hypothetical protein
MTKKSDIIAIRVDQNTVVHLHMNFGSGLNGSCLKATEERYPCTTFEIESHSRAETYKLCWLFMEH